MFEFLFVVVVVVLVVLVVLAALYEKVEMPEEEKAQPNNLVVILSSDRGLCGGIHSGLVKAVKAMMAEKQGRNTKIVACGDKARQILQRTHGM